MQTTVVFSAETLGYTTTRIPALVRTASGKLIAFCEARRGKGGDWDAIDLMMRTSLDGGQTWQRPKILAASSGEPTSNACPIVDADGTVHFIFQRNYERVYYQRSEDEGESWTAPRDITQTFEAYRTEYPWRVVAPGPGHGIALQSGRLLVPVWLSTGGSETDAAKRAHRPSCISTIFSDDHGVTWERGDIVVRHSDDAPNPSESVAVELSDGCVMLNMRTESRRHRRLLSFSPDGASNWSQPVFDDQLFEPICMASLVQAISDKGEQTLYFCNPDSSGQYAEDALPSKSLARENLTLRLSVDGGKHWFVAHVIEPDVAGYSDMATDLQGNLYCLYETGSRDGNMFANTEVRLARLEARALPIPHSRTLV